MMGSKERAACSKYELSAVLQNVQAVPRAYGHRQPPRRHSPGRISSTLPLTHSSDAALLSCFDGGYSRAQAEVRVDEVHQQGVIELAVGGVVVADVRLSQGEPAGLTLRAPADRGAH
jgi:hypothetical protein